MGIFANTPTATRARASLGRGWTVSTSCSPLSLAETPTNRSVSEPQDLASSSAKKWDVLEILWMFSSLLVYLSGTGDDHGLWGLCSRDHGDEGMRSLLHDLGRTFHNSTLGVFVFR